jgi:long-subunit acyl-CoA synthetase (AMP-forming)
MPDNENCSPVNKRTPWNKRKADRGETAPATKARLVDQNSIALRGANT